MFFSVSNYVGLSVASYAQKLCILWKATSGGIDTELLIADFSVQWAAMIACIFESKNGYETQFGFLFPG